MKTATHTKTFRGWLAGVKDEKTRAIIAQHIVRLQNGVGDVKPVGDGVRELRIDVGPGWRVYYIEVEGHVIVLLAGGTKRSQQADIAKAKQMVKDMKRPAETKSGAAKPAAKPRKK